MDIKKVYVAAKTVQEKRVAVALLGMVANSDTTTGRSDNMGFPYIYIDYADNVNSNHTTSGIARIEMTLDELFQAAKVGFKEPWEIPPEGYRLVTEGEREEYGKPIGKLMYTQKDRPRDGWDASGDHKGSRAWENANAYAVPTNFVFDDKERKKADLVAKAQELLKQAEEL